MDRGNSKHGRQLDEVMHREVRGHLRASPLGGRVQEWREPEPSGEQEPDVSAVPRPDRRPAGDSPMLMTDDDRQQRSRLGTYLPRSVFPADRDTLLRTARTAGAPDDILAELRRLPAHGSYATVARVWAALGHRMDERF